jgi:hypothetical protein
LALFFLSYALILPVAIFGLWHDQFLTPLLVFLAIASFLLLVSPSFSIPNSERWIWMLSYVFSFYAANGIFQLTHTSLALPRDNIGFKKFCGFFRRVNRNKLPITYMSLLALFGVAYAFGMMRPLYEQVQQYYPAQPLRTIISSTDLQEIAANLEWLNSQNKDHFTIDFIDQFDAPSSRWSVEGGETLAIENSTITLNVKNSGGCLHWTSFGFNYFGTIEVRFKFNEFSEGSHVLGFLTIRRSNGCGGGVVYFSEAITYWDPERMSSFSLAPLDHDWHTLKVTYNETCRLLSVDGLDTLCIEEGESFGTISLGELSGSHDHGGSLSIDYISVHGHLRPALVTSFKELGPVRINLDERFEVVTYVRDLPKALHQAGNESYTQTFILLPTDPYRSKFTILNEMPHYSIFGVNQGFHEGDLTYLQVASDKPQSGDAWFGVDDYSSWSGVVMKASANSSNGDVLFGPYITSGWDGVSILGKSYRAVFSLKVSSNLSSSDVVCVEVAYNAGCILKSMRIKASDFNSSDAWQDFQLTFTVPDSLNYGLEFRVKNLNSRITDVYVDQIFIRANS